MIKISDKHSCCGCWSCQQRCPKHCITMREDEEGFLYPFVDMSECIDCGLCEKSCPIINRGENVEPLKVIAAKNPDEEERMKSSSGGMFILLAREVIEKGGIVFGAVWDDKWEVKISCAETMEEVYPMLGSKYLQARVETAYKDAETYLKAGKRVLFSGSPCQIAGLHSFLRKDYPNLLTVDFLCHGAPSPGVWRRYLKEFMRKNTAVKAVDGKNTVSQSLNCMSSIEDIKFRDKRLGWKKFSFAVLKKSASKADKNSVSLSYPFNEDPYMRGFLSDIYLRPSCYGCVSKNGVSHSDITIADFWGINRIMPDYDDDKGVSLVLINTNRGGQIINMLTLDMRQSNLSDARATNGGFNDHLQPHPKRTEFYRRFTKGDESVEKIVTSLLRVPLRTKVTRKTKRLIKQLAKKVLPGSMIKQLKKLKA